MGRNTQRSFSISLNFSSIFTSQVNDKAQVRSTGKVNALTRQPVKGRKKGGGIRFGEMERDSLLGACTFVCAFPLLLVSHQSTPVGCVLIHHIPPSHSFAPSPAAHGASFLLHDRLMNVSDKHTALVCKACGGLLGAHSLPAAATEVGADGVARPLAVASLAESAVGGGGAASRVDRGRRMPMCRSCGTGANVVPISLPYVFRYLANELAAMNVR